MNPLDRVLNWLRPRDSHGSGAQSLPAPPDLFQEGDPESVEAWLRQEVAFWRGASRRAVKANDRRTWTLTAEFYETRLREHIERRQE